jgi:hypothetical protein
MKKLISKIGLLAFIIFALAACYPGGAEYTTDTDIVITDYDEQYNFGAVSTYFLSDSIQHILPEGEEPNTANDAFVISELVSNFDNLGWERLNPPDTNNPGPEPDVSVVVTIIKVQNYNIYSIPWYPYWGWYWKSTGGTKYWGYPGYGWGYPPYYGGTYVSSYTTGTVLWYLFDPNNVDEDSETIYMSWAGAINGVLGSSTSTTKDRVTKGISQAFRQSPYLSE